MLAYGEKIFKKKHWFIVPSLKGLPYYSSNASNRPTHTHAYYGEKYMVWTGMANKIKLMMVISFRPFILFFCLDWIIYMGAQFFLCNYYCNGSWWKPTEINLSDNDVSCQSLSICYSYEWLTVVFLAEEIKRFPLRRSTVVVGINQVTVEDIFFAHFLTPKQIIIEMPAS